MIPEIFRVNRFEFYYCRNSRQMNNDKYVFSQLTSFLDRNHFNYLVIKIKKFWGTSENAVKAQIYDAIITYCLVVVVQHDMRLGQPTYEVLQILSISPTDKTSLKDFFDKTDYHDVKRTNR